jgi:molybdopterin/thiamine biosynthesis adenylyltransferase
MYTNQVFNRFQRQINLKEIGWKGQEKLSQSKVTVIGAGGLGCPVLLYLASCGVGKLHIIDSDKIELTNLHRQILFGPQDLNNFKAEIAYKKLHLINELTQLSYSTIRFNRDNARELLANCDLIIDATDNFETRYAINDAAEILDIPVIYGAVQGFEGQVSIFNYKNGPNYRSVYPKEGEYKTVTCEENGILGIIPGIVGTLIANEALKLLLDFPKEELLVNKLLIYDFKKHTQFLMNL